MISRHSEGSNGFMIIFIIGVLVAIGGVVFTCAMKFGDTCEQIARERNLPCVPGTARWDEGGEHETGKCECTRSGGLEAGGIGVVQYNPW